MTIDEQVSVGLVNNIPKYVVWKGRSYTITKVGLHHTFREGRTLHHALFVVVGTFGFLGTGG